MSKKTLIIILIVVIFVALDVVGYVFFFQNKNSLTKTNDPASPDVIFPTGENRQLGTNEDVSFEDSPTSTEESLSTSSLSSESPAKSTAEENSSDQTNPDNLLFVSLASLKIGTITRTFLLEKTNGNLYEYLASGKVQRLSNTTFPGLEEVFWGQDKSGLRFFLRRFKNDSYNNTAGLFKISSQNSIGEITTETLSDNLLAIAVSPKKDQIFVLNGRSGGVDGYLGNFSLTAQQKIFNSPLSEWVISWPNQETLTFQTKPSVDVPGYLFFYNLKDKALDPVLRNIGGLNSLTSPDLTKILYSRNSLNGVYLYLYDVKQDKSMRLSLSTLPDKCLWSETGKNLFCAVPKNLPKASYPDDWYQGKIQFSDELWLINPENGNVNLISGSKNLGDLTNLSYNQSQNSIFAIDRSSKKLRVVKLEE